VRLLVVGVTTLSAVILYLDRYCISFAERYMTRELGLTDEEMSWILGSFFLAYAAAQVPSGWLADRFGPRRMLALYVAAWSLFTGLTSFATGFVTLLACRVAFGLAQAGAYPTSAGLLTRWMPFSHRGAASSVVACGGRIGGTIAQVLTGYLIVFGWQSVMQIYCVAGILVALLFWLIVRDRPREHSWCNLSEVRLIDGARADLEKPTAVGSVPMRQILLSTTLWLSCLSQFMTNLAWVFLATWLPRYLEEVHGVEAKLRGWLAGAPIFVGWFGILSGGWLTDRLVPKIGLRWGRGLPMALSRFVAAAAYLTCLLNPSPWSATVAFALVAFATDIGIGATWAFLQDVGGRHVGSVLGWTNMWGNFGAALSPWLLNKIVQNTHTWDAVFFTCAVAFFASGAAALGVDATRRITAPNE
jgi:ACS family glucarate transporter-like MFS transporter